MSNWAQNLEDFGINEYGEFNSMIQEIEKESIETSDPYVNSRETEDPEHNRAKRPRRSVVTNTSGNLFRHASRLDFIQAIVCAKEEELCILMHIVIDIMSRECHKDRVIGGDVELALERMVQKWKSFCIGCGHLKKWIQKKEEEARRRAENRDMEEARERERNRMRTRALLHATQKTGTASDPRESLETKESIAEQKEYEELLDVFGSDLLIDIGRTPEDLYQDTKNVRIGIIICMISKSKALQRLVRVGKFCAESLGHEYLYARIPKDSLDEFLAVTSVLRNAFMTQQTSPGWFVRVIQHMVIRGGVHGFVNGVLNVARKLETTRLSMNSVV